MKKSFLSVSLAVLVSQLCFAYAASANSNTPEEALLSSVIATQGQKLSQNQLKTQVQAELAHYDVSAPVQGRMQRTEEALVSLGIYSQAQVQALEDQVKSTDSELSQQQWDSPEAAQKALSTRLVNLVSHPAAGAEFSQCDEAITAGVLGAALLVTGLVKLEQGPPASAGAIGYNNYNVGWDLLANLGVVGLFIGVYGGSSVCN